MPDSVDNEQSVDAASRSSRIVIPSLDDVMPHIEEISSTDVGIVGSVKSLDLGGGVALFVLEQRNGKGLLAQLAHLPSIHLMLARHMDLNAAAFTIAFDVMEPTDNWITIEQSTADALLSGDPEALERIFDA